MNLQVECRINWNRPWWYRQLAATNAGSQCWSRPRHSEARRRDTR